MATTKKNRKTKTKTKAPQPKQPANKRLAESRSQATSSLLPIAEAIASEAGVKTIEYHDKGLTGKAWSKEQKILVPRPTTRRRLYVFAHECGHISFKGKTLTAHREEYLAELYAHEALQRHGIEVPEQETLKAKEYVATKIHQAVRRGAQSLDYEALDWTRKQHSKETRAWLRKHGWPAKPVRKGPDVSPKSSTHLDSREKVPKEVIDMSAIVDSAPQLAAVMEDDGSLLHWFSMYLKTNVDPESNTFRAKRDDIQRFLTFFHSKLRSFECDKWTPSMTKSYLKWLPKQKARNPRGGVTQRSLAPSTCARNIDTLRHAARWIHRQRPFVTGFPFTKRDVIQVEEPGWQGLTELDVTRLRAAAEQLVAIQTRASQRPRRNYAMFVLGLHTGLRVEEINSLEIAQYQEKHLRNVHRTKSGKFQDFFLDRPARDALDEYIEQERGDAAGTLFLSKNGRQLNQSDVYVVLQRIAKHANATLPEDEQIKIHPHLLRHTFLRQVTDKGDIRAAREVSGLKSDKYLWRYTKLTGEQVAQAVTNLYE